ncbi:MAG: hypothetical protein HYT28_00840 [Parcubacteria group bacterium]|nr:hypothetical protein [Parcubacteria group bacterium]
MFSVITKKYIYYIALVVAMIFVAVPFGAFAATEPSSPDVKLVTVQFSIDSSRLVSSGSQMTSVTGNNTETIQNTNGLHTAQIEIPKESNLFSIHVKWSWEDSGNTGTNDVIGVYDIAQNRFTNYMGNGGGPNGYVDSFRAVSYPKSIHTGKDDGGSGGPDPYQGNLSSHYFHLTVLDVSVTQFATPAPSAPPQTQSPSQAPPSSSASSAQTSNPAIIALLVTDPVSNITETKALLNGHLTVTGDTPVEMWFEWGVGVFDHTTSIRTIQNSGRSVSESIYGLAPNTQYIARLAARTPSATVYGDAVLFVTQPTPSNRASVSTYTPQNIDGDGALMRGYVNPRGSTDTVAWFEWGKTIPFTNTTPSMTLGGDSGTVSFPLNSLEENTRYYYRIVAVNSAGMSYGSTVDFKTGAVKESVSRGAPSVTTINAEQEGGGYIVVLKGYVDTKNVQTRTWFEYGKTTSLGRTTSRSDPRKESGSFSETLSGLEQGVVHYYRAVASNDNGVAYGNVLSVTPGGNTQVSAVFTAADTIYAVTDRAESVNEQSALVRGSILSADNRAVSQGWFEYGETEALGRETPIKNVGLVSVAGVSESLFNLAPETTYYYRFVAKQKEVVSRGAIQTFTTSVPERLIVSRAAPQTAQPPKISNGGSGLAAAVFLGDFAAFMPVTFIEWFLVFLLVLSFVVAWRQKYI